MQVKSQNPVVAIENKYPNSLVELFIAISHLKQLYRQGWLKKGISPDQCESVAEHSYGVGVLAMLIADMYFPSLDKEKLLRMALIHDLAEVYSGDITPEENINTQEKYRVEKESLSYLFRHFYPDAQLYLDIWDEYESGQTKEANLIRQIDKLEMAFQALTYEMIQDVDLSEFFTTTRKAISISEIIKIFNDLAGVRKKP